MVRRDDCANPKAVVRRDECAKPSSLLLSKGMRSLFLQLSIKVLRSPFPPNKHMVLTWPLNEGVSFIKLEKKITSFVFFFSGLVFCHVSTLYWLNCMGRQMAESAQGERRGTRPPPTAELFPTFPNPIYSRPTITQSTTDNAHTSAGSSLSFSFSLPMISNMQGGKIIFRNFFLPRNALRSMK